MTGEISNLFELLGIGGGSLAGGMVLFGIALWKAKTLTPVLQIGALGIPAVTILFGIGYLVFT